jgi:hypothetical protein
MKKLKTAVIFVLLALSLAGHQVSVLADDPEQENFGGETESGVYAPEPDVLAVPLTEPAPGPEYIEDEAAVLNVVLPAEVPFTIDPFEISGRGQIYSAVFPVRNMGETDALLTFTDMRVYFAHGDTEIVPMPALFDTDAAEMKAVCLVLNFGRDDLPPQILTDENREAMPVLLRGTENDPGGADSLALSFSGAVSCYPPADWQSGDITVQLTYAIHGVTPEFAEDFDQNDNSPGDE